MITRTSYSALGAVALLLAVPLLAQENVPSPPTAPIDPAQPAIRLVYKFKPGQTQRFRANLTSAMTMTMAGGPAMPGGAAGPGAIPLEMKGVLGYSEKVLGIREGVGTLQVAPYSMEMTTGAMGANIVAKLVNGKMVVTQNGRPVTPGEGPAGIVPSALSTAATTIYRSANGEVRQKENPAGAANVGNSSNPFFGGAMMGAAAQFPDHPVRVGESWETTRQFSGQGVGPGIPGEGGTVDVRLTHTLKEILQKGTRRIAIIETIGAGGTSTTAPPENNAAPGGDGAAPKPGDAAAAGPPLALTQNLTGTTYFDVDRGALITSRFNVDLNMKMALPIPIPAPEGAAAGAAGEPAGFRMSIEGQIGMKLSEVAETAKPAATGKKPATRRSRLRRGR